MARAPAQHLFAECVRYHAQDGERITIVMSPSSSAPLRKGGFLSSRPPQAKPGEPLVVVNHTVGNSMRLVRPTSGAVKALPSWALPALVVTAFGVWGSGFADPNYPLLITGGATTLAASWIGSGSVLLPRFKQLPANTVRP
jgi:hypothetical protein